MISYVNGDLLEAKADALVNAVNIMGVMGKGIALQFRQQFPEIYEAYRQACLAGELKPGKMFVEETGLDVPRLIVHFPTKRHWRDRSRMQDIETGLQDLAAVIQEYQITSIALPALGCGNGGLDWREVRPRIEAALSPLENVEILIYLPQHPADPALIAH